jgi:pSer/pThr/pTyr-binding forkhead associated (FHA) protein
VWEAVVCADRAQYERFATSGVSFPADYAELRFPLQAGEIRIGRGSGRADDPALEIDLRGPIEDPGISRLHAALERQDDGRWRVRDLGSTNGTTLNDDPTPVGTDGPVPLAAGDRIRLGAWTMITLRER